MPNESFAGCHNNNFAAFHVPWSRLVVVWSWPYGQVNSWAMKPENQESLDGHLRVLRTFTCPQSFQLSTFVRWCPSPFQVQVSFPSASWVKFNQEVEANLCDVCMQTKMQVVCRVQFGSQNHAVWLRYCICMVLTKSHHTMPNMCWILAVLLLVSFNGCL